MIFYFLVSRLCGDQSFAELPIGLSVLGDGTVFKCATPKCNHYDQQLEKPFTPKNNGKNHRKYPYLPYHPLKKGRRKDSTHGMRSHSQSLEHPSILFLFYLSHTLFSI